MNQFPVRHLIASGELSGEIAGAPVRHLRACSHVTEDSQLASSLPTNGEVRQAGKLSSSPPSPPPIGGEWRTSGPAKNRTEREERSMNDSSFDKPLCVKAKTDGVCRCGAKYSESHTNLNSVKPATCRGCCPHCGPSRKAD